MNYTTHSDRKDENTQDQSARPRLTAAEQQFSEVLGQALAVRWLHEQQRYLDEGPLQAKDVGDRNSLVN